ncbi:MAG: phage tail sheath family protein [Steroidobacter sp.]
MPEYKAPGVYVEEASFRARSIEGVSTSTTAFVGPTLLGPQSQGSTAVEALVTSFAEFEQHFGGLGDLQSMEGSRCNYVAHSARAFFNNGGEKLYVARVEPGAAATDYALAMHSLQQFTDVSLVAAPGYSARSDAVEIQQALIDHVERGRNQDRYCFAVLDAPPVATIDEMLAARAGIDASCAAIYYPWVTIDNPLATADANQAPELQLPPSGFVCGVFARVDAERGVWKAPANEPLQEVRGLQRHIDDQQQALLNAQDVNCIRSFTGRGTLLWGARTTSSDPEWKYVSIRRYALYLEQSISQGLEWALFEPNGERLWTAARQAVESFLFREWRSGALMGSKPEQAFFVRCDQSTMTQNEIDSGRLIVTIGVAPLRSGEFVVIRIGQWTATARSDGGSP